MAATISFSAEQRLSADFWISLEEFSSFSHPEFHFTIDHQLIERLNQTRKFIDHLLEKKIQVYGLTTGFADLRKQAVDARSAGELSKNLILSHDAGIGPSLDFEVIFGAMCLRVHSLSKGYSGFSVSSLQTLIGMINCRIVPEIPRTGSLGASGDLAFLARLGRAMMGEDVPVMYRGRRMSAKEALLSAKISPMIPQAKEGLALTNGTSFMASMVAHAYLRQTRWLENLFPLMGLFLNACSAIDAAFYESIQLVRGQRGQIYVAEKLRPYLPETDKTEVQNDYCIRCLPQILGPKIELIEEQKEKIEKELNAITDNPLIFRGDEMSSDVSEARKLLFEGTEWGVFSGGNFHGETSATVADAIAIANAKIALTLERQLTYLLNPFRNGKKLPIYLIADSKRAGLFSGFMITQYTANALAHKISLLAHPASSMNITSANESEDIVSYGATAAQKLLEQMDLLEELQAIYLLSVAQAYALARESMAFKNPACERVYEKLASEIRFPRIEDESFDEIYKKAAALLKKGI